jgi:hypothetical protein
MTYWKTFWSVCFSHKQNRYTWFIWSIAERKVQSVNSKKTLKISKGGNHNPHIEEKQTKCPKEKVQKNKQRSTEHTYKTKDRVTRTPLKKLGMNSGARIW